MEKLQSEVRRSGRPIKDVVNDALRAGLSREQPGDRRTFAVQPQDLGLRDGVTLDDVSALLDQVEGPSHP